MASYRVYFATREMYFIDVEAEDEATAALAVSQRLEDEEDGILYEDATETGRIDTEIVNTFLLEDD